MLFQGIPDAPLIGFSKAFQRILPYRLVQGIPEILARGFSKTFQMRLPEVVSRHSRGSCQRRFQGMPEAPEAFSRHSRDSCLPPTLLPSLPCSPP
jgi:hypothetical protein